jgi:tetratricopeptide (TPR) repeat protein
MSTWATRTLLGLLLTGCGHSYMGRAVDLYEQRRYVEAAEVFERTERRLAEEGMPERARYGLYRGAALFELGDRRRAERWLGYAFDVEREYPGSLDHEERSLLERTWLGTTGTVRRDSSSHKSEHESLVADTGTN